MYPLPDVGVSDAAGNDRGGRGSKASVDRGLEPPCGPGATRDASLGEDRDLNLRTGDLR